MGREDLPEEQTKLENYVGNVEDSDELGISVSGGQVKVMGHSSYAGIPNVVSVEESKHIDNEEERHHREVQFASSTRRHRSAWHIHLGL